MRDEEERRVVGHEGRLPVLAQALPLVNPEAMNILSLVSQSGDSNQKLRIKSAHTMKSTDLCEIKLRRRDHGSIRN